MYYYTSSSAVLSLTVARSNDSDTADLPVAPRHCSPNLNFDIVRAILAYCCTADLLQASLASHELRDEAMNERVSRPVHLKGADQANSFSRFMLAGDGFRIPHLRALTLEDIEESSLSPSSDHPLRESLHQATTVHELLVAFKALMSHPDNTLLEVLVRATALRDISILGCDLLFSTGSEFTNAVSALLHLRRLCVVVDILHTRTANILLDLTSSLETLKYPLDTGKNELGFFTPSYFKNAFLDTLANRQPYLKTLLFTCESLTSATSWNTPFRLVRVLDLTVLDRTIDFRHFAYLFPSLMELTIYAYGASSYSVHHASASRQFSIASQEAGYGWPCLDVLCGSLVDLYILAITVPVHRLGVRGRGFQLSDGRFGNVNAANLPDMFSDVISRSRPQCVELEFNIAESLHRSLGTVSDLLGGHDEHHPAGAVSHLVMGCFFRARPPLPNYTPPSTSDILVSTLCALPSRIVPSSDLTTTAPSSTTSLEHDIPASGALPCGISPSHTHAPGSPPRLADDRRYRVSLHRHGHRSSRHTCDVFRRQRGPGVGPRRERRSHPHDRPHDIDPRAERLGG